ncbi:MULTISPECIES: hypothetical protein [unclassified Cupriavidus]|uniref:hypothetical protein n=1 Tax=unclassified Cupriavidus TaxID=2640874 RepID=UPI00313B88D2
MRETATQMREARLQRLFDDCQRQVLQQVIGPFGLSMAMFDDKTGGSVTTTQNFAKGVVASDDDKVRYDRYRQSADAYDRGAYEVSDKDWQARRAKHSASGIDGYTGQTLSEDSDLDHIMPVKSIATDAKTHLSLGDVKDGKADVGRIKAMVNDDSNLVMTDGSLNSSKRDLDAMKWAAAKKAGGDGQTNAEHYGVDEAKLEEAYQTAKKNIDTTVDRSLLKKQAGEVLSTGLDQAGRMAVRQALGLLLTELVNGLFNEFKVLIRRGVAAGKSLFEEIKERLARVIQRVAAKLPDAMSQLLEGGVSGFMSNLLTFLINSFVTTAQRIVTALREVLLSLYRAFKMVAMRPADMTPREAMQEALKILSTAVTTVAGVLLTESVAAFMMSVPFLAPFADVVAPALVGILTGLLSAYLAFVIDSAFDRHALNERALDQLMEDAQSRAKMADALQENYVLSLRAFEQCAQAIRGYVEIGEAYGTAGRAAAATLASLESTNQATREQIARSDATVAYIASTQVDIETFLNNR